MDLHLEKKQDCTMYVRREPIEYLKMLEFYSIGPLEDFISYN